MTVGNQRILSVGSGFFFSFWFNSAALLRGWKLTVICCCDFCFYQHNKQKKGLEQLLEGEEIHGYFMYFKHLFFYKEAGAKETSMFSMLLVTGYQVLPPSIFSQFLYNSCFISQKLVCGFYVLLLSTSVPPELFGCVLVAHETLKINACSSFPV